VLDSELALLGGTDPVLLPPDPLEEALADAISEIVGGMVPGGPRLRDLHGVVTGAAIGTATRFRGEGGGIGSVPVSPSMRRVLRDSLVVEVLARYQTMRGSAATGDLIGETIEYLIELSGTRLESREVTHGVLITDLFADGSRPRFDYPADLRPAKRAPLLFDGRRSLLVVDAQGHPRFELPRRRLELAGRGVPGHLESGSLVAAATARLGGLGFFLGADRTIWTFVDGEPLLVRHSERWTAFPLELTAFVAGLIGGGRAAGIVVRTAFALAAQRQGAILAVVDDPNALDGVVPDKDRYDLRHGVGRRAMRPETRLHHLIDADDLDEDTLARLAGLDGATIVDRDAELLAYGAVVSSSGARSEGARTAAAATLSHTAAAVLMVSQDGGITVLHAGSVVATVLGRRAPD
jgi:hypothetical protein